MNPSQLLTSLSSPSSSSSSSTSRHTNFRLHFFGAALVTLCLAAFSSSTPLSRRASRRQTVTDGVICDVAGPEMVNFDKSTGNPEVFTLIKTGSCQVGFVDIYQIVSYSPRDYELFSYRTLEDGVSVEVMIHLAWPKPSASASDRNQYLVYKGYASEEAKNNGDQPIIQKFVKIEIVERQPEGNVENYRDPLASNLMTPPSPIYFLDEESAMANASCVNNNFRFTVKAQAKLQGVNPKLTLEVYVYQQSESGAWDFERSWSDGGETNSDWSIILGDVDTTITTTTSENKAEIAVDVANPLQDAYFVFNVLVEDELNWYRHGTSYFIAKWVQKECDGSTNDIDTIWEGIDTPPTTTTQATTILPNVIVDIEDNDKNDKDDEDKNNEEESTNKVENENISAGQNGIGKDAKDGAISFSSSSVSLLSVATTMFSCALCLLWSR